jgi:hypothetical protein
MPAVSDAQRRLMAIAEHHPEKLYAKNKGVADMTHKQLHDFASTSEKHLPEHVHHEHSNASYAMAHEARKKQKD